MPRVTVRLRDGSVEIFEDWHSGSSHRRITHRAEVDANGRLVVYRKLEVASSQDPLSWETESERTAAAGREDDWLSFGDGNSPLRGMTPRG